MPMSCIFNGFREYRYDHPYQDCSYPSGWLLSLYSVCQVHACPPHSLSRPLLRIDIEMPIDVGCCAEVAMSEPLLRQLVKDFFIILTKRLHLRVFRGLAHFVVEHTDYLVAYGFLAVLVEVNSNPIRGLADTLHKVGLFLFGGGCVRFFAIHIIIFLSALFTL